LRSGRGLQRGELNEEVGPTCLNGERRLRHWPKGDQGAFRASSYLTTRSGIKFRSLSIRWLVEEGCHAGATVPTKGGKSGKKEKPDRARWGGLEKGGVPSGKKGKKMFVKARRKKQALTNEPGVMQESDGRMRVPK